MSMRGIIPYLVFLFSIFNIGVCVSATVDVENDETTYETADIQDVQRLDLPDPLQFREMLLDPDIALPTRVLVLAKYFDARYPDDAINADFSQDIAVLFPELTQREVYDRTSFIRRSVLLYRMGQEYAQKIHEKILAPEPPPIHLEKKDLEEESFPYFDAGEGKFAIRTDFRKVLTYGQNPRDMRALEAFAQRQLDRKPQKTNFEKFKSMITKLEFSKIPFYGISEPNPFSGNAGIGSWVEKDGIRMRLISDVAQISDDTEFMAALHFEVPAYRFILALGAQKPMIQFDLTPPLLSAETFYPRPVAVVDTHLVGAYVDDFALPIQIRLQKTTADLSLRADVRFLSCDLSLHCQPLELSPSLDIEHGDETVFSGMRNFIRQAYFNIPQEGNKFLRLNSAYAQLTPDQTQVARIVFDFDYDVRAQNLTLFLEDDAQTDFSIPTITLTENKIYASVEPLNHQKELLGKTFTLTAALNPYTQIRRSFVLQPSDEDNKTLVHSFLLFRHAFYAGLLFVFSLAGFALWGLALGSSDKKKYLTGAMLGVFLTSNVMALVLYFLAQNHILYWGAPYRFAPYLIFAFLAAWLLRLHLHTPLLLVSHQERLKGFLAGALSVLLAPVSLAPMLSSVVGMALFQQSGALFLVANGFSLGVVLIYVVFLIKIPSSKLRELIRLVSLLLLYFLSAYIILLILMQLNLLQTISFLLLALLGGGILTYAFSFLKALSQTRISKRNKQKVLLAVFAIVAVPVSGISALGGFIRLPSSSEAPLSSELIQSEIYKGNTILIAIQADWCFWCWYNNLTVFDKRHLTNWQKQYHLRFHSVDATTPNRTIVDYLQKFNRAGAPLYVLYNYNLNSGYILPDVLTATGFEQTLNRLKL